MKICVTGANGFIGQKLVQMLSQQGHDINIMSRKEISMFPANVKLIKGDLTSADCPLESFLDNCDVIINCAGEVHKVELMHALHVEGTQRLIKAALKTAEQRGVTIHWVQLSSVGVYGPVQGRANEKRIVTENSPYQPKGEYEETKLESDKLVVKATDNKRMTYTIIRPSNVFGADMPNGTLRSLATTVKRGIFFYIGYFNSVATYVHVDDVVEVLMRSVTDSSAKGESFNVSNDCLLEEMIEGIADALNVKHPWLRFPERIIRILVGITRPLIMLPLTQETINILVSRTRYPTSKLNEKLNFTPRLDVPKIVSEVVQP